MTIRYDLLEVLATKLDEVPPKRFDYNSWVGSAWKGKMDFSCGTTACAGGWAGTLPEFHAAGFKLVARKYGSSDFSEASFYLHGDPVDAMGGLEGVLGITYACAEHLFLSCHSLYLCTEDRWPLRTELAVSPGVDATPEQVARHIRNFIKFMKKEGYTHFVDGVPVRGGAGA